MDRVQSLSAPRVHPSRLNSCREGFRAEPYGEAKLYRVCRGGHSDRVHWRIANSNDEIRRSRPRARCSGRGATARRVCATSVVWSWGCRNDRPTSGDPWPGVTHELDLASITAGLLVVHSVPANALRGLQRWRESTVTGLITGAMAVIAIGFLLHLGYGVTALFATQLVAVAVNLAVIVILLRRRLAGSPRRRDPPSEGFPGIARFTGLQWVIVVIGFAVAGKSEFFVLVRYAGSAELAYYSIGIAAAQAVLVMVEAAANAVIPAMAGFVALGSTTRAAVGFARALRIGLHVCIPITALLVVLGPPLIRASYGGAYRPAGTIFIIAVVALPVLASSYVAAAMLTALGKLRGVLVWSALAALVDLLFAFALIPRHGASGAAIANSAARLVVAVPVILLAVRLAPHAIGLRSTVLRVGGSSVAAGAIAWISLKYVPDQWAGLVVGCAAFVVSYWAAAFITKPLKEDDASWLLERASPIARRRFGGILAAMTLST